MSVTIYSKPIPQDVKDKIIEDNKKFQLEDGIEKYIKGELKE